mgnify:CR=1 FL=1
MGETVSFRLGKDLEKDLAKVEKKWQIDRSEVIRRLLFNAIKEWKIQNALNEIINHRVSIGKAAQECDISIWVLLDLLKERNIDWTNYGKEDLEKDLSLIK